MSGGEDFYGWMLLSLVEIEGPTDGKSYRFAVLGFETDADKAAAAPLAWPLASVDTAPVVLVVVNSLIEGYHKAGRIGCSAVFEVLPDLGASVSFFGLSELPDMLTECVQEYEITPEATADVVGGPDGS